MAAAGKKTARFFEIAGQSAPGDFVELFERAGWSVVQASISAPAPSPSRDVCDVVWADGKWEEGFALLAERPQPAAIGVVWGRPTAPDLLVALERHEALALSAWPPPDGLLPALGNAAERWIEARSTALRSGLEAIRGQLTSLPRQTLEHLVEEIRERLGCEAAAVLTAAEEDQEELEGQPFVLARSPDQPESGVFGELTEARRVSFNDSDALGTGSRTRLTWPLILEGDSFAGSFVLSWVGIRLPTPGDVAALELSAAFMVGALAYHRGRRELFEIQKASTEALASVEPAAGAPAAGAPAAGAPADDARRAMTRAFVTRLLQAYSRSSELEKLWASVSPSRIGAKNWLSSDPAAPDSAPPADLEHLIESGEGDEGLRFFRIGKAPGQDSAGWSGLLVAQFSSREAAAGHEPEMKSLVESFELGMSLLRRTADSEALVELSRVFAQVPEPAEALRQMLEIVRRETSSDGAKVMVLRQSPAGAMLELVQRSDTAGADRGFEPVRFEEAPSLVAWVLEHDDWLVIPKTVPARRIGLEPEKGWSGRHGEVTVTSRPEDHFGEIAPPDDEGTMLLVPLESHQRAAGVLSIWRDREANGEAIPYDRDLDTASLRHFAPHVASACARLLQLVKARQELAEISELDRRLLEADRLSEAYRAVTRGIRLIADAALAVLFTWEKNGGPGALYASAVEPLDFPDGLLAHVVRLHLSCGPEPEAWPAVIEEGLGSLGERPEERGLELWTVIVDGRPEGTARRCVALFDRAGSHAHADFLAPGWIREHCASFLGYAGAMLDRHVQVFPGWLLQQALASDAAVEDSRRGLLVRLARLLHRAVDADQVIVYRGGTIAGLGVETAWPMADSDQGFEVGRGDLTVEAFEDRQPRWVTSFEHDRALDRPALDRPAVDRLVARLGWEGLASWLCCPMEFEDRSVGVIKMLTRGGGHFFGEDHAKVAAGIAQYAAQEIQKDDRRRMVAELNSQAKKLSTAWGSSLGRSMVRALAAWAEQYLAPRTRIAVLAKAGDMVLVEHCSEELPESVKNQLPDLAERVNRQRPELYERGWLRGWGGVSAPIGLPGLDSLAGHLLFLNRAGFAKSSLDAAQEAAREMALVINMERLRREWTQDVAIFEHALIGPVQGIASTAKALALLAGRAGAEERLIDRAKRRVELEESFIRTWREGRRWRDSSMVRVKPKRQELRPIVERCFDRYRDQMARRDIRYALQWPYEGGLLVPFDAEALDLALTNLLDNAAKYAFFNRDVTVSVQTSRQGVAVFVEDVGHGIDESEDEEIYQAGRRGRHEDPFRVIPGRGLGLALARAVAEQHGGTLTHTSKPEGQEPGPKQPHRVRFKLELPWSRP